MLLNQQCWLWGQDIKRTDGNLLLAYGFERHRPAGEIAASTQYTLLHSGGLRVCLWGFGFYFGYDDGIYVNRYEFIPRAARFTESWRSAEQMSFSQK